MNDDDTMSKCHRTSYLEFEKKNVFHLIPRGKCCVMRCMPRSKKLCVVCAVRQRGTADQGASSVHKPARTSVRSIR